MQAGQRGRKAMATTEDRQHHRVVPDGVQESVRAIELIRTGAWRLRQDGDLQRPKQQPEHRGKEICRDQIQKGQDELQENARDRNKRGWLLRNK